ncbi:hypothetical protein [Amycolatopsis sp. DSM 110486]|uniref:hypothetical protein n=1 Tax=Amycolatopsis sp. DSM 110486 TaxID=2865832 RepID=UPI001C6A71A2|nr:hypothetical protein [Amycolatopsis sp. DSM 110486]QYN18918.1 hypothetical protein K1T34_40510 [Amycolatopsis sp. DSM 110486]
MADSRIRLQPRSPGLFVEREIYVGWDDVLQTYYAHVIDGTDDQGEERRIFEVGGDVREVTDPSRLVAAVQSYAEIPDNLGELLNISRVSRTATFTDLRDESRSYQNQQHYEERINELDRPDGFVTGLGRDDVVPVLALQGWDLAEVQAVRGGHAETYRRGDDEAVLHWDWPDSSRFNERLLSPVRVDGETYGVNSVQALEHALEQCSADRTDSQDASVSASRAEILPAEQGWSAAEAASRDGIDTEDLMSNSDELSAGLRTVDDFLEWLFFEDPPDDDEDFHSGLGM